MTDSTTEARLAIETVPVGLRVSGREVLVVGAGPVAARKASVYVDQGAVVTVVAPTHSPEMTAVAVHTRIHRRFRPEDLDQQWLVVTATGLPEVDNAVFVEAERRRIWCNGADAPEACSVILPAVARRGPITISISSGGTSPAAASWLRRRIERLLDTTTMSIVEVATRVRNDMRAAGQPTEVPGWAEVLGCAPDECRSRATDDGDSCNPGACRVVELVQQDGTDALEQQLVAAVTQP